MPIKVNQPTNEPQQERQTKTPQNVASQADQAISMIGGRTNEAVSNVANYIHRTLASREATVEQLSSAIAALHDPMLLEAEIIARVQQKIESNTITISAMPEPYKPETFRLPVLPTEIGYLPVS